MGRPKATLKLVTVCVIENPTGTEVATQATKNISVTFDTTIYQHDNDDVIIKRIAKKIEELCPNASGTIHVHTSSKGKKLSPPLEGIWDNIGKSKLYAVLDGNLQESAAVTINDDDGEVLEGLSNVEAVPVGPVPSPQDKNASLGEKRLASLINEAMESLNVVANSQVLKGLPNVEAVPVGPVPSSQDEKASLGEKRLASLINEAVESLNVVANSLPTRSDAAAQVAQLLSGAGQVFKSLPLDGQRDVIDVAADITNVTTKWLCEMIHEHAFEAQIDVWQASLGKHIALETEPTLEAQELKPDDFEELSMAVEFIKQNGAVENMDFDVSDFKLTEDKAGMDSKIPDLKMLLPLDSEDNLGPIDGNNPFTDSITPDGLTMPLARDANFWENLGIQYLPQSGLTGGDVPDLDWGGKLVEGLSTDTFMN